MLAGLSEAEQEDAWREIEETLSTFELDGGGFEAPCELLVSAGRAP
jgi:hypothetical protein